MQTHHLSLHSSSSSVLESMMSGSSSSFEHQIQGNNICKVPRQSFLTLAKNRRFATMMEIMDRSEDYDLDAWLFPGSDTTTTPVDTITLTAGASLNNTFISSSSSSTFSTSSPRTRRRPSFPLSPTRKNNDEYNLSLFRGETPLHILLRYNPTEELVHRLTDYLSHSAKSLGVPEDSVDMLGRTPLHVATANGCSVAVIERLLQGVSAAMPAFAKDATGRHALHWACANPQGHRSLSRLGLLRKNNKFVESMEMVNNMVQVIKVLLRAYPESVFIADHDGNRPKDLARIHNADERILLLLSRKERCCELDNQYQKNFASVADTKTVARDDALPTTLPYHSRDDVSSIGSTALSCYEKEEELVTDDPIMMWKQSPFQKMTKSDEVIRFVEQSILPRPPLVMEEFDLFGHELFME